jgi:hypothetical protein
MAIRTIFYQFNMGDVEDPEIYCASPIWDWQQTDYGKWCMAHTTGQPSYQISPDMTTYGYRCTVYGDLEEQDYTFHQLKWQGHVSFKR